jgi:hypothetical protein
MWCKHALQLHAKIKRGDLRMIARAADATYGEHNTRANRPRKITLNVTLLLSSKRNWTQNKGGTLSAMPFCCNWCLICGAFKLACAHLHASSCFWNCATIDPSTHVHIPLATSPQATLTLNQSWYPLCTHDLPGDHSALCTVQLVLQCWALCLQTVKELSIHVTSLQ